MRGENNEYTVLSLEDLTFHAFDFFYDNFANDARFTGKRWWTSLEMTPKRQIEKGTWDKIARARVAGPSEQDKWIIWSAKVERGGNV